MSKFLFCFCLIFLCTVEANAQADFSFWPDNKINKNSFFQSVNELKIGKSPLLNDRLKPTRQEFMRWPNFPLTAADIADRQRKNNQPVGKQIVDEFIGAVANDIIYGKKPPTANIPRF